MIIWIASLFGTIV